VAAPAAQCDWELSCCATSLQFAGQADGIWDIDGSVQISSLNVGTSLSGSLGYTILPGLEGELLRGACLLSRTEAPTVHFSVHGSAPASMSLTLFGEQVSSAGVGLSLCAGLTGAVEDVICENPSTCPLKSGVRLDMDLPPIDIHWFRIEPRTFPIVALGNGQVCP